MNQSAQVAICTRHGEARDVVEIQEKNLPAPKPGQVRVRMLAAPINPSDLLFCQGNYGIGPQPPTSVGLEGVGIVETSGGGWFGRLLRGQRVSVISRQPGTWGTFCLTESQTVIPLPTSLSDEQAAVFFINPASALLMTRWILKVPRGSWIMQSGAGSALGRMVIRLGNHFGFRTINIVRRNEQVHELQQLGGDAVFCADESTSPNEFTEQIRDICHDDLPRYAVDPVGGRLGGMLFESLGEQGRMLCFASLAGAPIPIDPRTMITHHRQLKGFWLGTVMQSLSLIQKLQFIRQLGQLHQQGVFQVETFETFPLAQVTAALDAAARNHGAKKVLLKLDLES